MMRLAIFDLDSTLIDTVRVTSPAIGENVARFGLAAPPESAIREAMGLQDPLFYRALFPGKSADSPAVLVYNVTIRKP